MSRLGCSRKHLLIGLLALFSCTGQSVVAAEAESLKRLEQHARDFLLSQNNETADDVRVRVVPIDRRLRLARCTGPVIAFLPSAAQTTGNTTVGLRCDGSTQWELFVSARVIASAPVLVAARPLARGTILDAGDLRSEKHDLSRLQRGYETQIDRLVGKQLKRRLRAGAVITPQLLTSPVLVRRGKTVPIIVERNGMKVRGTGVALGDAAAGETLRARSPSSSRIVEGRVNEAGELRINL